MNIDEIIAIIKKSKMTELCNNCPKFFYCDTKNLLCKNQIIDEVRKNYLESVFNKEQED